MALALGQALDQAVAQALGQAVVTERQCLTQGSMLTTTAARGQQ